MAASDDTESGVSRLRTVTPLSDETGNSQMNAIGWIMFIIMGIVLLPLLPIILLIYLFDRLVGS